MFLDLEEARKQGMFEVPEIPEELHRELFRLAYEVREREPWERFLDHDWYGIVSPDTGEVQIVSIMGADRQLFAVQLYLPEEGIRFWNRIIETEEVDEGMLLYDRRMVECEFCDGDELPKEALDLNERFPPPGERKRDHGYVTIRGYRPEYYPWFPEEEEARAMETALRLLEPFERHMKEHEDEYGFDLDAEAELIPIFELREGGDRTRAEDWEIKRGPFPQAVPEPLPEAPPDDIFCARMQSLKVKRGTSWETGAQILPIPVPEGGRLVFPTAVMTGAPECDELPPPMVATPKDSRIGQFRKSFAQTAEAVGYLPETLLVSSGEAEAALAELAERSGMRIEQVEHLPVLSEVLESLNEQVELAAQQGRDAESEEPDDEGAGGRAGPPRELSGKCFVMRIDLKGAKPPIWRRISVPVEASFADLHFAIQGAMGWGNMHLHAFEVRDGKQALLRIEPEEETQLAAPFHGEPEAVPEERVTLQEIVEQGVRSIHYCYDFGDGWEHTIKIEKTIEGEKSAAAVELLAGRGACPPEDCGGLGGFYALLDGDHPFLEDWDEKDLAKYRDPKFDPVKEQGPRR